MWVPGSRGQRGWADRDPGPPVTVSTSRRQGTVGTWPAFSWASRWALSCPSWAAVSFEWKTPFDVLLPELPLEGVDVAALLEAALNTVAPSAPPTSIEPASMAATTPLRPKFIWITSFLFDPLAFSDSSKATARVGQGCQRDLETG
jgi:hypothetical protein